MDFGEFISAADDDAGELTVFIESLVDDPSIFFDLSTSERSIWEERLDRALAICCDKISIEEQ